LANIKSFDTYQGYHSKFLAGKAATVAVTSAACHRPSLPLPLSTLQNSGKAYVLEVLPVVAALHP
jgi:hypothetical protein